MLPKPGTVNDCIALQVKSVLHQYPPDVNTSSEGPLAEYQFWKQRTEDLRGILLQVNSEGRTLSILDHHMTHARKTATAISHQTDA